MSEQQNKGVKNSPEKYPQDWLMSEDEVAELQKVDRDMRLKINAMLDDIKAKS